MRGKKLRSGAAITLLLGCVLLAFAPARAGDDAAGKIRTALTQWRDDFNAGEIGRLCDIFAPDLVVTYQGLPERDHAAFCGQLQATRANPALDLHYDLTIEEIMVADGLGVARVTWMLTSSVDGSAPETRIERGVDIFRRQPDGAWRIARFIAYDNAS